MIETSLPYLLWQKFYMCMCRQYFLDMFANTLDLLDTSYLEMAGSDRVVII